MRSLVVSVTAVVLCLACGGGEGGGADETGGGDAAATAALGTASIGGTVLFTGTPPSNPSIDMSEEEACRAKYPSAPTDPQVVVSNGRLGNVFIPVTGGVASP